MDVGDTCVIVGPFHVSGCDNLLGAEVELLRFLDTDLWFVKLLPDYEDKYPVSEFYLQTENLSGPEKTQKKLV